MEFKALLGQMRQFMNSPARLSAGLLLCVIFLAGRASAQADEERWAVNFKETDIKELVRFVADKTGKTMVINPAVKGTVQVISQRQVNKDELYDLFLSILHVHNYAAIEFGDVVRVIPVKDARTSPVPVATGSGGRGDSEVVTQVIQLENISAAKLIPVLRPLVPQQAYMAAYVPSNAIIVSDTSANIERIQKVIKNIDLSAQGSTEVVELKYAAAEEVVRMLEQLEKGRAGKDQAADKELLLVADKRTNSVLIKGAQLEQQRIQSLIKTLDTPLAQSGNVRVVYLEYANAKDLATVLTKIVTNMERLSAQQDKTKTNAQATATIEADEGTNALIMTADADVMQSLTSVIERLDIRRAQVLVEAIIVEIEDDDARALGLQWLFLDANGGYGSSSTGPESILPSTIGSVASIASDDDAAAGLASTIAATSGQIFGFGDKGDDLSFNVVLNALNNNSDTNILSTPSLLTMDNQEASIVVGKNVPFVTGSYSSAGSSTNPNNPFQTIERQSVGITLKVTPHINEGDSLVLEIAQEISSLAGDAGDFATSDVVTNERKIDTKILADDGQVIVLGGLIQDKVSDSVQKIPLLGDIPFLGRLFKNSSTSVKKTHLMIFLRSTIVRDSHTLTGATAEKYRYIRDIQNAQVEAGVDLIDNDRIPLLPEWEEQLKRLQQQSSEVDVDLIQDSVPDIIPVQVP